LDISSTPEWKLAQEPNKTFEEVRVRCLRFFQSKDYRYMTEKIALQEVYYSNPDLVHVTLEEYHDAAGGMWSRRPAYKHTLWRVTNLALTAAFWQVSEVRFYQDELCMEEVGPVGSIAEGGSTCSGSSMLATNGKVNAFDRDDETYWIAECAYPLPNTSALACGPREAFLGMDFGDFAVVVRCMRILQTPQQVGAISTTQTHTRGFGLEGWDGSKYVEMERWWDWEWRHNILEDWEPTWMTPYLGVGLGDYFVGKWEDTRPPNRSAVIISNDDYTKTTWIIHELEFYEEITCEGVKVEGRSISMQGATATNVSDLVFDGDIAPETWWQSNCSSFEGNSSLSRPGACDRQEAWIGLFFRPDLGRVLPNIQCLRLLQSRKQLYTAQSINLWHWMGGEWVLFQNHRDLGGGWWNRRPAVPYSMWRAVNEGGSLEQWRVMEIRAYRDDLCLNETTRGEPLGSGALNYNDHFRLAFDDSTMTGWGADCEACNETGVHWVGQQLPVYADDHLQEMNVVRCIRVWQSPRLEEQVRFIRFDIWTGGDWTDSPFAENGIVEVAGGGSWLRQPALTLSKWRLRPATNRDTIWRLAEVRFYADSDCLHELRMPDITGGSSVMLSGYRKETFYGASDMFSEGFYAVDGDRDTSFAIRHEPSNELPGWFALDFLSELNWVRCVRLQQGEQTPEQSDSVVLEFWDGAKFVGSDPELSPREVALNGLGGGGWQRRPARDGTIWRVENLDYVPEGWVIYELEFHTDAACGGAGNWSGLGEYYGPEVAISSGYVPSSVVPKSKHGPHKAFDKDPNTQWLSQCFAIPERLEPIGVPSPPVGCHPRQAWIGLDLGIKPQVVRCVRLLQAGYRRMQSSTVALSKWDGNNWKQVEEYSGLGGSTWHQRPAGPNTMWRVVHTAAVEKQCRGQLSRNNNRLWGVAELQFFSDQDCSVPIIGGVPIVSGTVEAYRPTIMDDTSYDASRAIDGDQDTVWAANCHYGWDFYNVSRVDCNDEWLGVNYGSVAVEVRCMRIMQSRLESSTCCDPGTDLRLERWNGTTWLEATWRHEPPPAAPEDFRYLGADFRMMGQCPPDSYEDPIYMSRIWEQRARKDSDNCIVPLTGAIALLGKSFCIEHPACTEAVGGAGDCCPIGDGSTSESRCCCSFLQTEIIFVDEEELNPFRRDFNVEYGVLILAERLPYFGAVIAVFLYFTAQCARPNAQDSVATWAGRPGCCSFFRRMIARVLWPLMSWRSFLAEGDAIFVRVCLWFCLPGPNRTGPRMAQALRIIPWVVICAWVGGAFPWIAMGGLLGQFLLKVLVFLSYAIRFAISPYDPLDERDMQKRELVSATTLDKDDSSPSGQELLYAFLGTGLVGVIFFLKFTFDVLILRSQMISYGLIAVIESDRIVDIFPGMVSILKDPAMVLYQILSWGSTLMSTAIGFLMGIPKCEGACVLVATAALVMVLTGVGQWLNYDLFGLFAAARQSVKKTKPECQRLLTDGTVLASLSFQFGMIQCAMLLFTRALQLASPFETRVWMCEYDDFTAKIIGRVFIMLAALFGMFFVFLCSNGHFLGQDYLTRDIARRLKVNLEGLDPDGIGPTGGWVRWTVAFSAIPTTFGMWLDRWNVRGYLVKERAEVYAEQLQDPQPCKYCGQVHVKYERIITATARQLSLALQILPYGTLLGKAAEYCNEPPLIYWGEKLTCLKPKLANEPRPDLGSKSVSTKILLFTADACALFIEWGIPLLRRLCTLALYGMVLLATFTLTEENLLEWGQEVIWYAFVIAFLKAALELLLEVVLSALIGLIHKMIFEELDGGVDLTSTVVRTVLGQTLSGACVSVILCVILPDTGITSKWGGIFLGGFLGWLFSNVILAFNILLELPPMQPDDPPFNAAFPTAAKTAVSFTSGVIMCFVSWEAVDLRVAIGIAIFIAAIQVVVLKMILLERRPRPARDDPTCQDEGRWIASPSIIVFKTKRFLPAMVSIPTGSLVGGLFADSVGENPFARVMASAPSGFLTAFVLVLAVNRFQDKTPQLIGFFSGIFVWVCILQWNLAVSILCGAFTFALVGSILEEKENQQKVADLVRKWEDEDELKAARARRRGSKANEDGGSRMSSKSSGGPINREKRLALAMKRANRGLELYPGADNSMIFVSSSHPAAPLEDMPEQEMLEMSDGQAEDTMKALPSYSMVPGETTRPATSATPDGVGVGAGQLRQVEDRPPSSALRAVAAADENDAALEAAATVEALVAAAGTPPGTPAPRGPAAAPAQGEAEGERGEQPAGDEDAGRSMGTAAPTVAATPPPMTPSRRERQKPLPLEGIPTTPGSHRHRRSSPGGDGGGSSSRFAATAPPAAGQFSSRALAPQPVATGPQPIVDNFRLERNDEDLPAPPPKEIMSPALIGWDDPDEAPKDDAMLTRWDHGVPQAARTKRRSRAAPVKPSVWGAVKQAPPRRVDTGRDPRIGATFGSTMAAAASTGDPQAALTYGNGGDGSNGQLALAELPWQASPSGGGGGGSASGSVGVSRVASTAASRRGSR